MGSGAKSTPQKKKNLPDKASALTTAASGNFAEYFSPRDHLRPLLSASAQSHLMKPYICHQLFRAQTSTRTRQLSANKVGQSASETSIKSVKVYTGGFILIHGCCRKLISLPHFFFFFFCRSCLFLCVCLCASAQAYFYCEKH